MNWFYSDGKTQNGPVSDSQLDELLRSGKISEKTLVWREGMDQWQPLNSTRPGALEAQSGVTCVECGKAFPLEETIKLNGSPVCAQCKPIFLQRIAEAATMPSAASLWRNNGRLVARSETVFPDRCVKCNAPAGGFLLKRTLYWVHPAYLLLLLCNLIVLLVVYLIVRKKAVVHIGLCEQHRWKRKIGGIIAGSSVGLGIALLGCAAAFNSGPFLAAGLVVLFGGTVTGGLMARTIAPTKIEKEYVWLAGVHRDFIANFPEWNG
ncbi:MAG TPA: DUF4339 domain-containing protein [Candidatus Sulfotelmatobacter sp.]|nr:DUF4339 domain-containing protein [Candidatus Sulfotelmatobacter sp.]